MTKTITTVKLPMFEGEVRPDQQELAYQLFSRGMELKLKKKDICYKVSTNAYVKFKDALKLHDMWVKTLDVTTKQLILDEMLMSEDHKQTFPAREVQEGTVSDALDDAESTRAFEGVSGIDY